MDNELQVTLQSIHHHALYPVPGSDVANWYEAFFVPLCSQGLLVPPLLGMEIRGAAVKPVRGVAGPTGPRLSSASPPRPHREQWVAFLEQVRKVVLRPEARAAHEAALQLATALARRLIDQVDVSPLYTRGRLEPERLLGFESQRLARDPAVPAALHAAWQFLEQHVMAGATDELIPQSRTLPLAGRVRPAMDPFLPMLLPDERRPFGSVAVEQIPGTVPRAQNPRQDRWMAGEFLGRAPGPLPDQLGRLAPLELALLAEAADSDLRDLFLYRANEQGLLQNQYRMPRMARREPQALLQVDLCDHRDDHRLAARPSRPEAKRAPLPVISWYRALLVEIIHQFACLPGTEHWLKTLAVGHGGVTREPRADGDLRQLQQELGRSPRRALEALFREYPGLFRPGPAIRDVASLAPRHRRFDFWLRVTMGWAELGRLAAPDWSAAHQRGVRVKCQHDGVWGFAVGQCCFEVDRLRLERLNRAATSPSVAAQEILRWALVGGALRPGTKQSSVEFRHVEFDR